MEKFGVKVEPWRKTGQEIIVIPPTTPQMDYYGNKDWYATTTARLDEITARPVITKWKKLSSLREFCANAWAVVTYASVAGVEASLMGIPVFCTDRCPSWPVNAGPLERIETPEYSDARADMAASLCYATWNDKEMSKVKWVEYEYSLCE